MSDIVERLEDMFFRFGTESLDDAANRRIQTAKDAADEIKKLRAALSRAKELFLQDESQKAFIEVCAALGEKECKETES